MNRLSRFANCQTLEEAKGLYKALTRENHPDLGGDLRTMQEINAEYAEFCADFAKADGYRRQQDAHAEDRKSAADFHDLEQVAELLRKRIEFALTLDGVEVELMGFWVWLTGNTKAHKETIKADTENQDIKWRWASEKQAWYFAGIPSFNREKRTLDEIRSMHGSQRFSRQQRADSELLNA